MIPPSVLLVECLGRSHRRVPTAVTLETFHVVQVVRLSSQDVPTAYAYELEAATIVQPEQVVAAVQRVVGTPVSA